MYRWELDKRNILAPNWRKYYMDELEWIKHLKKVGYGEKEIEKGLKRDEFTDGEQIYSGYSNIKIRKCKIGFFLNLSKHFSKRRVDIWKSGGGLI